VPLHPRRQPSRFARFPVTVLALCSGLAAGGCSSEPPAPPPPEVAYVQGVEVPLLDQLGPAAAPIESMNNGDEVEVLGTRPRWTQVRTADGQTGWLQSRFLVDAAVREKFRALALQSASLPSQGTALLKRDASLHAEPGRDTDTFYRLSEGVETEVLSHRVASRGSARRTSPRTSSEDTGSEEEPSAELVVQTPEDWLLVRDSERRTGWMLESLADMNPPLEVGQYREGLRIRAWFVIHREMDDGVEHPWYLWATMRRLAGLPYDFDEIRVFVWNPRRDRYETSYRERGLIGFYPIGVGTRDTPGGTSPTFALQVEDETGKRLEKQYVMEGRIVRRAP
jgi:uncharacterized protein YgiM (DUF1202 family)